MSRERLPFIGSSGSKATAKSTLQRHHQTNNRRLNQQQQTSSSSSSSQPKPGPSTTTTTILLADTTMTPWGGLDLSESSFTSIPAPLPPRPPPPPPPPPPPAPQPTPSTPYRGRREEDEESSSMDSETPSPALVAPQNNAGGVGRGLRARRRVLPQRRAPRPARLPPLRPVTNLSFSRSFTFSFFELPLHQSPRCRAERVRNLLLLLKQIHY